MKFGIQHKGVTITPHLQPKLRTGQFPFSTYKQAKKWGLWNYKGDTRNWRVIAAPHRSPT